MSLTAALTWLGMVAGGLISLGVIWKLGVRPIWSAVRRVQAVHELIIEDLPTFMHDMREWRMETDVTLKQLQPNSGSSMFDRVKRTEELLRDHVGNDELHSKADVMHG